MKPLAKIEVGGLTIGPVNFSDMGYDPEESTFIDHEVSCLRINAAHRAAVRRELEAFRERAAIETCCYCEMGDKAFRNEAGDWLHKPNGYEACACEAESIRSLSIDEFLDREARHGG